MKTPQVAALPGMTPLGLKTNDDLCARIAKLQKYLGEATVDVERLSHQRNELVKTCIDLMLLCDGWENEGSICTGARALLAELGAHTPVKAPL